MNADLQALHDLFATARQQFRYLPDMLAFGVNEHWMAPAEIRKQLAGNGFVVGDCDDFASLCAMLARQQGMPARFVICLTEQGDSHLVCEVDGWIFDNRQPGLVGRDDLDYTWLAISGFSPGEPWRTIAA